MEKQITMQEEVTTTEQMESLLKDLQQIILEFLPRLKGSVSFHLNVDRLRSDHSIDCSLSIIKIFNKVTINLWLYAFDSYEENLEELAKFKGRIKKFIE